MASSDPIAGINRLERRARVMAAIRRFFEQEGYLDVETPIRIPAPAPEIHIDARESESWYLQTSPELCMKRLLAAGFSKIFQICKCFRKGERGNRHLPEMTLLEWYTVGEDYRHMMQQCERLVTHVLRYLEMTVDLPYQGRTIDIRPPWNRLSVKEAFEEYGGCSVREALRQDRFDDIMGLAIEPRLGWDRPVFLYDYPAACGALARLKPGQPHLAERFELYIGGLELCNAFTELTDPIEQRRRFDDESERRRIAGKAVYPVAEPFLKALSSMPKATGNALGIDRLVMLLCDTQRIDDVVTFTPETL